MRADLSMGLAARGHRGDTSTRPWPLEELAMKWIVSFVCLLCAFGLGEASAQVDQSSTECSTPNLDSATAEALPYYDNNQVLEDYLEQSGYNDLQYLSVPP